MADPIRALTAKVWADSDATLATLVASVNDFLAGAGTPALRDTAQLIDLQLRNDGSVYYAVVIYSE